MLGKVRTVPGCLTEGDQIAFACSSGAHPSVPPDPRRSQAPGTQAGAPLPVVPPAPELQLTGAVPLNLRWAPRVWWAGGLFKKWSVGKATPGGGGGESEVSEHHPQLAGPSASAGHSRRERQQTGGHCSSRTPEGGVCAQSLRLAHLLPGHLHFS